MDDWIDRLHEEGLSKKADTEIERQRSEIAKEHSFGWCREILKAVSADVEHFKKTFAARERVEGPIQESDSFYVVRTRQYPLRMVRFKCVAAAIQYEKTSRATYDASEIGEQGALLVKADFDQSAWLEHKGDKLLTPEDASEFLLRELLEAARP